MCFALCQVPFPNLDLSKKNSVLFNKLWGQACVDMVIWHSIKTLSDIRIDLSSHLRILLSKFCDSIQANWSSRTLLYMIWRPLGLVSQPALLTWHKFLFIRIELHIVVHHRANLQEGTWSLQSCWVHRLQNSIGSQCLPQTVRDFCSRPQTVEDFCSRPIDTMNASYSKQ